MNIVSKFLKEKIILVLNLFKQSEEIEESKLKWNKLAKRNARYFVLTDKGENISEEEFRKAGERDVGEYFLDDDILNQKVSKKSEVLEIGCGIGRLSEFIAPHVCNLYGVDISEKMINQAKKRLPHLKNINFCATDGLSFPLNDDSIDVVFSFIVFQHMPNKWVVRKNVEEISRVLKQGGVAKIQLRGIPVNKSRWYYGPYYDRDKVRNLIDGLPLISMKLEGEGSKYFWVWFKKQ